MKTHAFAWIIFAAISTQYANAATVTFHPWTSRSFTPTEIFFGAPAGGKIFSFHVTTDADIISVGRVLAQTTGTFSQVPTLPPLDFPSPNPPPPFLPYVQTPGRTVQLGLHFPGDGTESTGWGDLSLDGPMTNFTFAQFVLVPASAAWNFSGNIAVAGATGPELFPFSFGVPEPASASLAFAAVVSMLAVGRRSGRRANRRGGVEVS